MHTDTESTSLAQRLTLCAEKIGGKRALAQSTHISEAQIFRYLNGQSDIPAHRLIAIANATKTSPTWLLTGQEAESTSPYPPFKESLLLQIIRLTEELLIEYEKSFTPIQRAQAINFIYKALRHEETLRNTELTLTKAHMLGFINFLVDIRSEETLSVLNDALDYFEYSGDRAEDYKTTAGEFSAFVNYIVRAYEYYYNSITGKAYFDRLGTQILPHTAKQLDIVIQTVQKATPNQRLSVLDIGCGSARDASYIHRHYENIDIHGVDQSQSAIDICKKLEQSEHLPVDSIKKSDIRAIPFPKEFFNLLISRQAFYCLPYLPNSGLGVENLLQEAYRSLKPQGYFYIVSRFGQGTEYLPFCQYYNEETFKKLVESQGFTVTWFKENRADIAVSSQCHSIVNTQDKYNLIFRALIQKH